MTCLRMVDPGVRWYARHLRYVPVLHEGWPASRSPQVEKVPVDVAVQEAVLTRPLFVPPTTTGNVTPEKTMRVVGSRDIGGCR